MVLSVADYIRHIDDTEGEVLLEGVEKEFRLDIFSASGTSVKPSNQYCTTR